MERTREVLHCGWLIKSPPEHKMNRGFFKAQWKRRYFVLQETVSQMPGQNSSLIYYKDQKQRDKKGTIDLEHCEEVLSALDSPHYPHLFGIKTLHKKGGSRTYYLAAESEEEMSKWVNSLCTVLGLKENDDLPSPTELRSEVSLENLNDIAPLSSPPQNMTSSNTSLDGKPPDIPPPRENKGYIDLAECYSGPGADDTGAISSIPADFAPPPPPAKTHQKMAAQSDSGDMGATYDSPQKSYKQNAPSGAVNVDDNDNVYKYPPSSHAQVLGNEPPEESLGSVYKLPPSRPSARPVHNNNNQQQQSAFFQVPPARTTQFKNQSEQAGSREGTDEDDDVYKVPPARGGGEQVEYDVPPIPKSATVQRKPSERDSGSSTASKGSQGHTDDSGFSEGLTTEARYRQQLKDIHGVGQPSSHNESGSATVYQGKNSLLEVVPPPPPTHHNTKAGGGMASDMAAARSESRYINLPTNSKSHPESGLPQKNPDVAYDFPVSNHPSPRRKKSDVEILGMSPPPPPCDNKGAMKLHRYTNAPPGYMPNTNGGGSSYLPMSPTSSTGSGDSYLPMDSNKRDSSSYLPMDNSQPLPPKSNYAKQDYLPMDNANPAKEGYMPMAGAGPGDDSYLPADPGSPQDSYLPADRNHDSIYGIITDSSMTSRSSDIYAFPPSNIPVTEEVYDVSPSNRPVVSLQTMLPAPVTRTSGVYASPPSNKPVTSQNQRSMLDAYPPAPGRDSTYDTPPPRPILTKKPPSNSSPRFKPKDKPLPVQFNISRSRSFKRNISPPRGPDVLLPQRNNANDSSSSDEEDDSSESKSVSSHERSMENVPPKPHQPQPSIPKRSLHSTPPPPKKAGEIQYLDLDLDLPKDSSDPERSPAACTKSPSRTVLLSSSATEYREIDFVKTEALTLTKKDIENKRKSSEKSVDE